jgi:hypothetical protein
MSFSSIARNFSSYKNCSPSDILVEYKISNKTKDVIQPSKALPEKFRKSDTIFFISHAKKS